MSDSNAKGDRRERELVNRLDEAGFAVLRAPASGSATARELPDALAGDGRAFYAIEAKSSGGDPIYLDGAEIEALLFFARNFGARPRVGVRFDREDWYFFHPGDLHVTDGGNYRVKMETALEDGEPFDAFVDTGGSGTAGEDGVAAGDGEGSSGACETKADRPAASDTTPRPAGDGGRDGSLTATSAPGRDDGPSQSTLDVLTAFERGDLTKDEAAAMLE